MSVKLEVKFLNGIDIEGSYQTEAEAMASIHENWKLLWLNISKPRLNKLPKPKQT